MIADTNRKEVCFRKYSFRQMTTQGAGSNTHQKKLTTEEMKKGAGASPLFLELTPQNQNPSRGWVLATPGSQSCTMLALYRANGVPANPDTPAVR